MRNTLLTSWLRSDNTWKIVVGSWRTHLDNGYSGNSGRRPALLRLKQDIQDGRVDVVVVCNLARLFRSFSRLQHFMRLLQEHQVGLVCLQ
jgi:DNA invertase Pin-like site-specific DNA recombinase